MAAAEKAAAVETSELAAAIQALANATNKVDPLKQVSILEATPMTPWNPDGSVRPKLKRASFQNGARLDEGRMTAEEITLFNQIKPGLYNHKKWEVAKGKNKGIDIRYKNKTIEQRIDLKGDARNLATMLRMIVTEQEARAAAKKAGKSDDEDED
jgi:hypothetical protein